MLIKFLGRVRYGDFVRILNYALAPDGGTQVIELETGDGERISIGLDGRMDSPGSGKQLFIGASPESPDARMLPVGGAEEREVVLLMDKWLETTQGFLRREALMDAEPETLQSQDRLDRFALEFLLEIRNRDIAP